MACEKPSPVCMQLNLCQMCGNGMSSSGKNQEIVNYQKLVDSEVPRYSQIIPDYRYDEIEKGLLRNKGKADKNEKPTPFQICIPLSAASGKGQTGSDADKGEKPTDGGKESCFSKDKDKEKEREKEKEKEKDEQRPGSSPVSKASCFPGGADGGKPVKMMLCLPCPPPEGATGGASGGAPGSGGSKRSSKPTDYTYRCESRELRGGNLYSCCQCLKRNGLQHDCPRTPCQGRPACLTKPWPDCWPSGGCHGIDFSREKGTRRYDPCCDARFDKKDCGNCAGGGGGGGGRGQKAEAGGNMMVVVCPPSPCGQ